MRKFLENLRKNIFLYTIIFLLLFIISHFVLNIFNIQYRQWIYWSVLAVFIIGIILGIVQIVRKKDENIKTAFIIMGMFVTIIIVAFWKMFLLLFAFLYTPEHVIEKDDIHKRHICPNCGYIFDEEIFDLVRANYGIMNENYMCQQIQLLMDSVSDKLNLSKERYVSLRQQLREEESAFQAEKNEFDIIFIKFRKIWFTLIKKNILDYSHSFPIKISKN